VDILVSATQINAKRTCDRQWALRTIAKVETPKTKALEMGTEVDDTQLQPYLKLGREFDYTRESGYIAGSALEYLPKPKAPGLEIQKRFELGSLGPTPFWYLGFMDLYAPAGASSAVPGVAGDLPLVLDFKTTSDFKWAKSEDPNHWNYLGKDVQANIYAMQALVETGAKGVDLVWLYMRTRGARKAKRVHLRVMADQVLEQFDSIEVTGGDIARTRIAASWAKTQEQQIEFAKSLPPTPDACGSFGGCPYRHICNLSPRDHLDYSKLLNGVEFGEVEGGMDLMASLQMRASEAPAAEKPMLGINPPEKDLPAQTPAPAVSPSMALAEQKAKAAVESLMETAGATEAPAEVPGNLSGVGTPPKKRGRPRKAAEVVVYPPSVVVEASESPTIPAPPPVEAASSNIYSLIADSFFVLASAYRKLAEKDSA
jgi:hypothetical protein